MNQNLSPAATLAPALAAKPTGKAKPTARNRADLSKPIPRGVAILYTVFAVSSRSTYDDLSPTAIRAIDSLGYQVEPNPKGDTLPARIKRGTAPMPPAALKGYALALYETDRGFAGCSLPRTDDAGGVLPAGDIIRLAGVGGGTRITV